LKSVFQFSVSFTVAYMYVEVQTNSLARVAMSAYLTWLQVYVM